MSEDVSLWNEDLRSITPEVVRLVTEGRYLVLFV